MKGALVVTACLPVPEVFENSLQSHLTLSQSRALYRRFLLDTMETTRDVEGMDFYLAYTPRGSRSELDTFVPEPFRIIFQDGGTPGERLSRLTSRLLRAGYEKVLLLCASHPDLPACLLHQAVEALDREMVDVVFGPNERGGFYLLGVKEPHPSLFSGTDWEAATVQTQVTGWAGEKQLGLTTLARWYDIRTVDDLRRNLKYFTLRRRSPSSGPGEKTGRYLERIQRRIDVVHC